MNKQILLDFHNGNKRILFYHDNVRVDEKSYTTDTAAVHAFRCMLINDGYTAKRESPEERVRRLINEEYKYRKEATNGTHQHGQENHQELRQVHSTEESDSE